MISKICNTNFLNEPGVKVQYCNRNQSRYLEKTKIGIKFNTTRKFLMKSRRTVSILERDKLRKAAVIEVKTLMTQKTMILLSKY